ncbi:MAG: hypothetical protein AAF962_18220 [Actinomycetota bacterium]
MVKADQPLWGRGLRMVLLAELVDRREASIGELTSALTAAGFDLEGRPSKVVSDALRWEVDAGRIERVGRWRYRYRAAAGTRVRRARLLARRSRAWQRGPQRGRPPWSDLRWLWAS